MAMVQRIDLLILVCLVEIHAQSAEPFDHLALIQSIRVPPEFAVTVAAKEPAVRFPMFACLDADGRLYVAESSGNEQLLTRDQFRDLLAYLQSLK